MVEHEGDYHHGKTIREFRMKLGKTQQWLAAHWPRSDNKGIGVDWRYVQAVEYGKKRIEDDSTLRKLCDLLDIPYWRFGLSEYDPYNPDALPGRGKRMLDETLDTAECLVRQIWYLRYKGLLVPTWASLQRLNNLFEYFGNELPPPLRLETRFCQLYADVQCINGVMAIEAGRYSEALEAYSGMYGTAKGLGKASPATLAHALLNIGVEKGRAGNKMEAVSYLETARDVAFEAAKPWAALVNSYLSRAYASSGDALRFQRANDTARNLARYLKLDYMQDVEGVYYSPSDVLAERSYGYLELNEPQKTLSMKDEITRQIALEHNTRLGTWILLDWARAYRMLGDVEQSVQAGREFFHQAREMKSPHMISSLSRFVEELEQDGYGSVQGVKDLRDELFQEQIWQSN
jgi:tetratricopeptide (TPR) repeat protein